MDLASLHEDLLKLVRSKNGCQYMDLSNGVLDYVALSKNGCINILHLNIRGFMKNLDNLLLLLNELRDKGVVIHVIGICEKLLNKSSIQLANLENYQSINKCRESRHGGGVTLLIHDSIKFLRLLETPFNESCESILAEFSLKNQKFLFSEIYRPLNSDIPTFMESVTSIMKLIESHKLVFLAGDYNLDLMNVDKHVNTSNFMSTLLDNNCAPCMFIPTRVTHSSSTLIDNIFLKDESMKIHSSYVITDAMSDHYPCLVSLETESVDTDDVCIIKRKLTDTIMLKIQEHLLFEDWTQVNVLSIDAAYQYLVNRITDAMDEFAPKKTVVIKQYDKFREPWFTVAMKKCNSKCRKLCKKARLSGDRNDFQKYKTYRNVLNKVKDCEKRKFYAELFQKIGKNSQLFWCSI